MMNLTAAAKQELIQKAQANGAISTPGGFRDRSRVHHVGARQSVVNRSGRSYVMDMVSTQLLNKPTDLVMPKSPADSSGGWMTWANWNNTTGNAISLLKTTWTVPPAPATNSGQLVYLFNGLQNPAGSEMLQPVLQWGVSGAGGGNCWSIASWHVDSSGNAFCTPAIQVTEGDVLTGVMTLTGSYADGTHNYLCEFAGIAGTSLLALGLVELTDAVETLEAYGVTALSDYPAAALVDMTQIDLELAGSPVAMAWTGFNAASPAFGEHATVVSNAVSAAQVSLYF